MGWRARRSRRFLHISRFVLVDMWTKQPTLSHQQQRDQGTGCAVAKPLTIARLVLQPQYTRVITLWAWKESSPVVGSSAKMSLGRAMSSTAMLSRLRSPPDRPRVFLSPMRVALTLARPRRAIISSTTRSLSEAVEVPLESWAAMRRVSLGGVTAVRRRCCVVDSMPRSLAISGTALALCTWQVTALAAGGAP